MRLFLPRCRTLPLPLLNLIRFLCAQLSSLSRSGWMAAQPAGDLHPAMETGGSARPLRNTRVTLHVSAFVFRTRCSCPAVLCSACVGSGRRCSSVGEGRCVSEGHESRGGRARACCVCASDTSHSASWNEPRCLLQWDVVEKHQDVGVLERRPE